MGLLVPFRKSRMMPLATADQDRWLSEKQNPAYRAAYIFKEKNTFQMEGVFFNFPVIGKYGIIGIRFT